MSQRKIKKINKDKPVTIDLTRALETPEGDPMQEGTAKEGEEGETFDLRKALMIALIKPDSEKGLSRSQKSRNYKLFKKIRDAESEGEVTVTVADIEPLLEMTFRGWGGWIYGQVEEMLAPLSEATLALVTPDGGGND